MLSSSSCMKVCPLPPFTTLRFVDQWILSMSLLLLLDLPCNGSWSVFFLVILALLTDLPVVIADLPGSSKPRCLAMWFGTLSDVDHGLTLVLAWGDPFDLPCRVLIYHNSMRWLLIYTWCGSGGVLLLYLALRNLLWEQFRKQTCNWNETIHERRSECFVRAFKKGLDLH